MAHKGIQETAHADNMGMRCMETCKCARVGNINWYATVSFRRSQVGGPPLRYICTPLGILLVVRCVHLFWSDSSTGYDTLGIPKYIDQVLFLH